jgi:hypothetical protein
MFRRAILAIAIAVGMTVAGAVPAQAIPPGETLLVIAYFSDPAKTILVGQIWNGCGQPGGALGFKSDYRTICFTPC